MKEKLEDLFYDVTDKISDIVSALKEKFEDFEIDKKKVIIIVALMMVLIALVSCTVIKHKKSSNDNETMDADEIAVNGDSDAWWKKYLQTGAGEAEAKPYKTKELSWDAVPGAIEYNVYRATEEDGEYVCIAVVKEPHYIDTTAENGKTYYYKTAAVKTVTVTKENGVTEQVTEEQTIAQEEIKEEVVTVIPTTTEKATDKDEKTTDKDEKTTEKEEKTTKKETTEKTTVAPTYANPTVIRSSTSASGSKIPSALSSFYNYVDAITNATNSAAKKQYPGGYSSSALASACGSNVTDITGSSFPSLGYKKPNASYTKCYRFTKEVTSTNINALVNSVKYAGYVFELPVGADVQSFANYLLSNTSSTYKASNTLISQYFTISYKAVAYYSIVDNTGNGVSYVFYMVSAN